MLIWNVACGHTHHHCSAGHLGHSEASWATWWFKSPPPPTARAHVYSISFYTRKLKRNANSLKNVNIGPILIATLIHSKTNSKIEYLWAGKYGHTRFPSWNAIWFVPGKSGWIQITKLLEIIYLFSANCIPGSMWRHCTGTSSEPMSLREWGYSTA